MQDLRTLFDQFIAPLRRENEKGTEASIISEDDILRIFSVAEQILGVNDSILTKISLGLESKRLSVIIGEVFSEVSCVFPSRYPNIPF